MADKGKKLVDLLYGQPMEKGGAAFGVFPQMKPRRSRQDPEAAKQVPVDLARGFAAGALGMPGDVESLIRLLPGLSEETILPTSEDILKRIPGGSDTPASRAASGLGILGGGFYTGPGSAARAVSSVAGALPKAAKEFVQAAGQPAVNVIKPKGGNWLTGSVEKAVEPLKMRGLTQAQADEMAARPTPIMMAREGVLSKSDEALNQWIDRNLANYVKKEMATPEDPVRRLAEQGIIHAPSEQVGINRYRAPDVRARLGTEQLGKSEAAKAWEDAADTAIAGQTVGERKELSREGVYSHLYEPWMAKLDPNERVWAPMEGKLSEGLGFDHIIDVLREDLATGRIRPEQLNKVSMEQAVRRTYEYDQAMAKKMREAQIKATEGMPVYKEYPEGFRWIELSAPEDVNAALEYQKKFNKELGRRVAAHIGDKHGNIPVEKIKQEIIQELGPNPAQKLEQALKYEGETMGHCVGGYCPDVMEGRSRIFSLRDAKGEPHVTVETRPMSDSEFQRSVNWSEYRKLQDQSQELANKWLAEQRAQAPSSIIQIKGKQNRAPKEEYLPFVQDFVRSGQWSDVGDLQNTGLYKADPEELGMFIPEDPRLRNLPGRRTDDLIKAKEAGLFGDKKYVTRQEWEDILRRQIESESGPLSPAEGQAKGGSVHISNNPDTMRLELAGGGALSKVAMEALSKAKLLREEMAAKAALQAQYAKQMEGVYTKDMPTFEQWKAGKQQAAVPTSDPALEKEANLKRFAGKSKVTDEQGNPLVVYHGKTKGDLKGPGFSPEEQAKRKMSHSVEGAYYFSSSPNVASGYADFGGMNRGKLKGKLTTQGTVFPVYLKMENPLVIDAPLTEYGRPEYMTWHDIPIPEQFADKVKPFLSWKEGRSTIDDVVRAAKESGQYDGVIINNVFDPHTRGTKESATTYVTFEPTQIKSAIGNKGTYDPTDPDITKAAGGSVDRLTPQDMLYLTSHPDFAKMTAQQQREAVVNMGDRELSERMKGKMAEGGEVTIPDMTDGGKVIDGGPFKKGGKVQFTDNLDTMRLAVGRK